ncbi:MAG: VOC family protein [Solirubrobacteraceae bacterium]
MTDTIDPATAIGIVRLTVSDLDRSVTFYERTLGLLAREPKASTVVLASPDGVPLVELEGDLAAHPLDRRATGLFHLAILVPSRLELARSLGRVAVNGWPLDGASDHLVSEALYLSDPDGNGIEIYRDRPRVEWPRSNGQLRMATLPLDLDHLLGELSSRGPAVGTTDPSASRSVAGAADAPGVPDSVPGDTRMGHVHLQVSDLQEAEEFYSGLLGFEVTVRGYPGALFVSAGGYHHHIGLNTWHSAGAKPAPSGSIGLRDFEVVLPDERALDEIVGRVRAAGLGADAAARGARVCDPSGNAVVLSSG